MRNDADAVACSCAVHQVFILRVAPKTKQQLKTKKNEKPQQQQQGKTFDARAVHMESVAQTIGFSRSRSRRSRCCCWS